MPQCKMATNPRISQAGTAALRIKTAEIVATCPKMGHFGGQGPGFIGVRV
jgi:hypothetical protein